MKLTLLLILLGLSSITLAQDQISVESSKDIILEKPHDSPLFVGGIQMNEGDQEKWVNTVKEVGMNTVQVTVYAHQGRWNENNIWYYENEPGVIQEIKEAKAAGLNVVLVLRLQLDHAFHSNKFLWHGSIFPEGDYLLQRWFEEYGRFVKKWATISEQEGVDVLVIGSELNALFTTKSCTHLPGLESYYMNKEKQEEYRNRMMSHKDRFKETDLYSPGCPKYLSLENYLDEEINCKESWAKTVTLSDSLNQLDAINLRRTVQNWYWERLIENIREVYTGKMTIAANFDNYQEVAFWSKLDFIGINAYFPLRQLDSTSNLKSQIRDNWNSILDEFSAFQLRNNLHNKPLLFTEIGYGRHAGSTLAPWQGSGFSLLINSVADSLIIWKEQSRDLEERNMAMRLLLETIQEKNLPFAGLLYWKLTSKEDQLKYDPFALHIGSESKDELQDILVKFLDTKLEK